MGSSLEKICDIENLKKAHLNARKNKTHYKEVKMVDNNLDYYISNLQSLLLNKNYVTSKYVVFKKITDNGKIRDIYKLPYYPDRIIHHAIIQIIEPIWKRSLIRDTYSSIKGRGIHDGINRINEALKDIENTKYCLKLDISKYYPSINNSILKKVIRSKIKDNNLLWLLDIIIDSTNGIPIGNYLSQYFGNIYLSELDHFMKNKNRYYFRYCDDIVIFNSDKEFLFKLKNEIIEYLINKRDLKLKSNHQIFPVDDRSVNFLGYRFFHKFRLLRKSIKIKFIRLIKRIKKYHHNMSVTEIINSIMSYYGWLKYGNCLRLINKYIDEEIFEIVNNLCFTYNIKNPLKRIYI